jgi:hypothetical protein
MSATHTCRSHLSARRPVFPYRLGRPHSAAGRGAAPSQAERDAGNTLRQIALSEGELPRRWPRSPCDERRSWRRDAAGAASRRSRVALIRSAAGLSRGIDEGASSRLHRTSRAVPAGRFLVVARGETRRMRAARRRTVCARRCRASSEGALRGRRPGRRRVGLTPDRARRGRQRRTTSAPAAAADGCDRRARRSGCADPR